MRRNFISGTVELIDGKKQIDNVVLLSEEKFFLKLQQVCKSEQFYEKARSVLSNNKSISIRNNYFVISTKKSN